MLPIVSAVKKFLSQELPFYTILSAPPSVGKTIGLPWLLFLERGLRVVVYLPTRDLAFQAAKSACTYWGFTLGEEIGYWIAGNRFFSEDTFVVYATTGTAIASSDGSLTDFYSLEGMFDVVIFDEFHLLKDDQVALEAKYWKMYVEGTCPFQHMIVMSATLNAQFISRSRQNAPIVRLEVHGEHALIQLSRGESVLNDILAQVSLNRDVLVFFASVAEVLEMATMIQESNASCIVITYYADAPEDQKASVFSNSGELPRVILSTPIANSGINPPPRSGCNMCVIDTGYENRPRIIKRGKDALVRVIISQDEAIQRRNRANRFCQGYFIDHCPVVFEEREEHTPPEMVGEVPEKVMLQMLANGLQLAYLPLIYSYPTSILAEAKRRLECWGFIEVSSHCITKLGLQALRMLVTDLVGVRILLEAERLGVFDDAVIMCAVLDAESLTHPNRNWLKFGHPRCDLITEVRLFKRASYLEGTSASSAIYEQEGISYEAYLCVKKLYEKLTQRLGQVPNVHEQSKDRDAILETCVISGFLTNIYEVVNLKDFDRSSKLVLDDRSGAGKVVVGAKSSYELVLGDCLLGRSFTIAGEVIKDGKPVYYSGSVVEYITLVNPRDLLRDNPHLKLTVHKYVWDLINHYSALLCGYTYDQLHTLTSHNAIDDQLLSWRLPLCFSNGYTAVWSIPNNKPVHFDLNPDDQLPSDFRIGDYWDCQLISGRHRRWRVVPLQPATEFNYYRAVLDVLNRWQERYGHRTNY